MAHRERSLRRILGYRSPLGVVKCKRLHKTHKNLFAEVGEEDLELEGGEAFLGGALAYGRQGYVMGVLGVGLPRY